MTIEIDMKTKKYFNLWILSMAVALMVIGIIVGMRENGWLRGFIEI